MSFAEVKAFQVLPEKLEAFEELVVEMSEAQKTSLGCISIRYFKRFYTYDDGIQEPPRTLKKDRRGCQVLLFLGIRYD